MRRAARGRRTLAAALVLALTALPGCIIVASEGESDMHWLDEDGTMEFGGLHHFARMDHLKLRIARLEEHVDHCAGCRAGGSAPASPDSTTH